MATFDQPTSGLGAPEREAPTVGQADTAAPGIAGPQALVTSLKRSDVVTPYRFRGLLALDDFERHARRLLPHMIFQYVAGEQSKADRRSHAAAAAYADYALPAANDASTPPAATAATVDLFGEIYAAPFGVAPLGGAAFIAYRVATSCSPKPLRQMNVPMILSASSLIKLEDVHRTEPTRRGFKAYIPGDQTRIDRLLDACCRGHRLSYASLSRLTPRVLGNREHNTRSGFSMPIKVTPKVAWQSATHPRWLLGTVAQTFLKHGAPHFENTEAERGPPMMSQGAVRNTIARDQLSWKNLEAIRKRWSGNLLVKGLLAPEDVEIAKDCGADGIILSTHGGRQLDHAIAPLDVLPEIAARKGSLKIIVDSGIRRGTDVMKALALGADFVLLGRPFMFGAALGGAAGVEHAMRILKEELNRDMALIGVNCLSELNPDFLRRVPRRS